VNNVKNDGPELIEPDRPASGLDLRSALI
jgi:hypothetical protein